MKILVINEYSKDYMDRYPDDSCTELCQEEQLIAAEISGEIHTSIEDFQNAFNEGRVSSHDQLIFIEERKYFLFGDDDTKIAYFEEGIEGVMKATSTVKTVESFLEYDVNGIAGNTMAYGWYIELTEAEFNKYKEFVENNMD